SADGVNGVGALIADQRTGHRDLDGVISGAQVERAGIGDFDADLVEAGRFLDEASVQGQRAGAIDENRRVVRGGGEREPAERDGAGANGQRGRTTVKDHRAISDQSQVLGDKDATVFTGWNVDRAARWRGIDSSLETRPA